MNKSKKSNALLNPLLRQVQDIRSALKKVTRPKSPQAQELRKVRTKTVSYSNVAQIEKVKKISSIQLTKDKMAKVQKTLEIQSVSKQNYQARIKDDNWFFQYKDHFLQKKVVPTNRTPPKNNPEKKSEPRQESIPVLNSLIKLREKDPRTQIMNRMTSEVAKNKGYLSKNQAHNQVKRQLVDWPQKRSTPYGEVKVGRQEKANENFQFIDSVVKIKEEPFFEKELQKKRMNIFLFLNNPFHPDFMSARQILQKHNFAVDSSLNLNNNKMNLEIYRAISPLARLTHLKQNSAVLTWQFKLTQNDLTMNMKSLSVDDLMIAARGLADPDSIITREHHLMKMDSLLDKQDQLAVGEEANSNTTQFNFVEYTPEKAQIQYFKTIPINNVQQREQKISEKYNNMLKKINSLQKECENQTVKDKETMNRIHKQKEEVLLKQLSKVEQQNWGKEGSKNIEKKIRHAKIKKDKIENIKVNALTTSLRIKNQLEKELKKNNKSNPKKRTKSLL